MGKNPLHLKVDGKKQAHVILDPCLLKKGILAVVTIPVAGVWSVKGDLKKSKHGRSFHQHNPLPRHSKVRDEQYKNSNVSDYFTLNTLVCCVSAKLWH